MANNRKTLHDLLESLAEAKSSHRLIGGLVAGAYGKPRATVDVDLLVPRGHRAALIRSMVGRGYRAQESDDMVRFCRGRSEVAVADVVWRDAHPVLRAAYREAIDALMLGHAVTAVTRGAFVALKYHAASSPTRQEEDKHLDVSDLIYAVKRGFSNEDAAVALKVIAKSYRGADKHLASLIDDIRNGRPVRV